MLRGQPAQRSEIAGEGIAEARRAVDRWRARRRRVVVDDEVAGLPGAAARSELAQGVAAHRVRWMRGIADQVDRDRRHLVVVGNLVAAAPPLCLEPRLAQGKGDNRSRGMADL